MEQLESVLPGKEASIRYVSLVNSFWCTLLKLLQKFSFIYLFSVIYVPYYVFV